MHLRRNYKANRPSDVRQFTQEIARLSNAGPVGACQAKRMIEAASKTPEGRELVRNARLSARIEAESQKVDFSNVKVHAGASAQKLQNSLQSQAFTSGNHIFFREGDYSPDANSGAELIAHELTHVVQQSNKR